MDMGGLDSHQKLEKSFYLRLKRANDCSTSLNIAANGSRRGGTFKYNHYTWLFGDFVYVLGHSFDKWYQIYNGKKITFFPPDSVSIWL